MVFVFLFAGMQDLLTQETVFDVKKHYAKAEYMIPMRDGIKLFTIIYTPKDTSQEYPILLYRTPYSIRPYGPDNYRRRLGPSGKFDMDGYIFVYQDVRGKFKSKVNSRSSSRSSLIKRALRTSMRILTPTIQSNGC